MTIEEIKLWLGIAAASATVAVTYIFRPLKKLKEHWERRKKIQVLPEEFININSRIKLLENAQIASLHDKIYNKCHYYINEGWVSSDDLANLVVLYNAYTALGGNGTAKTLYEKVLKLPNTKQGKEK